MVDVLRIAVERREKLNREVRELDGFIRMAETLIRGDRSRGSGGEVDTLQVRFNNGEVLPPTSADGDGSEQGSLERDNHPGPSRSGAA